MKLSNHPTPLALAITALVIGCSDPKGVSGPDATDVRFAKPSCPGHPSCGDPPAPAGNATIDLTGDVTTASSQPVVISKDSKNWLSGSGGGQDFDIVDALSLFAAAGSPTPAALGGCVTDPPDLAASDPAGLQRLIDRLTDAPQSRDFRFAIDRKVADDMNGNINQTWFDDVDGRGYRTRVSGADVTSPSTDVYDFTGGSIVSWDTSIGEEIELICPNGGSVRMTLNR
ncbi:MAG: hypothetical protein R3195_01695 [Gemmatimonadota bacterium]|nr:hypothetical protein [Gemmatimonadota bacterium]